MNKWCLVLLIFIVGCSTPSDELEILSVAFCPLDDCLELFLNYTASAASLDCAYYDIDLGPLLERLSEKNARVVVDSDYYNDLREYGFTFDSGNGYMHNKFCVINSSVVWTGSMNPTVNGVSKNNNNVIVLKSPRLASAYLEEFEELWQGDFNGGDRGSAFVKHENRSVQVLFCPEDECKGRILDVLESAHESIHFMTFSFTDKDIAEVLIAKTREGIVVSGVMEKRRVNMKYNVFDYLVENGVNASFDSNPHVMHHKVFIVDSRIVITGSMNPTKSGNERNDENVVIIEDEDVARSYVEEFSYVSRGP